MGGCGLLNVNMVEKPGGLEEGALAEIVEGCREVIGLIEAEHNETVAGARDLRNLLERFLEGVEAAENKALSEVRECTLGLDAQISSSGGFKADALHTRDGRMADYARFLRKEGFVPGPLSKVNFELTKRIFPIGEADKDKSVDLRFVLATLFNEEGFFDEERLRLRNGTQRKGFGEKTMHLFRGFLRYYGIIDEEGWCDERLWAEFERSGRGGEVDKG